MDAHTSQLLTRFINTFPRLDDLTLYNESDLLTAGLDAGRDGSPFARRQWRPAKIQTDPAALIELYRFLPAPFPPLYEQLILNYRWLRVDLGETLMLLANPPAPNFLPLLQQIRSDPIFTKILFPAGLIPFAHASSIDYDPICFDTVHRLPDGDCPILRLEHESILCLEKIGGIVPIAHSFHDLMQRIIAEADPN